MDGYPLQFPPQAHSGWKVFVQLSPEQISTLAYILAEAKLSLSVFGIAASVAERLGVAERDAVELVSFLSGISGIMESNRLSVGELIGNLRGAIERSNDRSLIPSDWTAALDGLSAVLRAARGSLAIAIKALRLSQQNPRLFQGARTTSDLRPVFSLDKEGEIVASVVTHCLTIEYRNEARADDVITIWLDAEDIAQLKSVLDAAQSKDRALRSFADASSLPVLSWNPQTAEGKDK